MGRARCSVSSLRMAKPPVVEAVTTPAYLPGASLSRSSASLMDSRRELKGLQGSGRILSFGFAGNDAGLCSSAAGWRSWRALDA